MSVSYGGDKITFEDGSTVGSGWQGFKNRIINGAMAISQRGTSFTGITGGPYTLDRMNWGVAAGGTWTVTQDSSAPPGFQKSFKASCTTISSTPAQVRLIHPIEGFNVADLAYGTASAKPITISFWLKSNKTGTCALSLECSTSGIYYCANFTINAADTWEYKTITIEGNTSVALNTTNGYGLGISWWFAGNSSVTGGGLSPNQWVNDGTYNSIAKNLSINLADSTSNYVNITGIQCEVGRQASSFEYRPYTTELQLCQRYYWRSTGASYTMHGIGFAFSTGACDIYSKFPVTMRTAPTTALSSGVTVQVVTTQYAVTSLSTTNGTGVDTAFLRCNTSGTFTQGAGASLINNANTSQYFEATAEL